MPWKSSPFQSSQGATPGSVGSPVKPSGIAAATKTSPTAPNYGSTGITPPVASTGTAIGASAPGTGYPTAQYPSTSNGVASTASPQCAGLHGKHGRSPWRRRLWHPVGRRCRQEWIPMVRPAPLRPRFVRRCFDTRRTAPANPYGSSAASPYGAAPAGASYNPSASAAPPAFSHNALVSLIQFGRQRAKQLFAKYAQQLFVQRAEQLFAKYAQQLFVQRPQTAMPRPIRPWPTPATPFVPPRRIRVLSQAVRAAARAAIALGPIGTARPQSRIATATAAPATDMETLARTSVRRRDTMRQRLPPIATHRRAAVRPR